MSVEIRNPCDQRFDDMAPRGEGRFCEACERVVVDLSRFTRREAEARVARAEAAGDRLCRVLRLDARTGEAVFRPEPSRARGWAGGLVLAVALSGGCDAESALVDPAVEVPDAEPVDAQGVAPAGDSGTLAAPAPEIAAPGVAALAPMEPTSVESMSRPPDLQTRAVPIVELARPHDDPTPTAEQRALTARKRPRHHSPSIAGYTVVSDPGW